MAIYMETTQGDVQKVLERLENERGKFSLAMLYKRDGLPETKWNLIISAAWADRLGRADTIQVVTRALSDGLNLENKHAISRVTTLPTSDEFVQEITSLHQVAGPGAAVPIRNASAAGIPIGIGWIFYSR